MRGVRPRFVGWLLVAGALAGCSQAPAPPADTGAREVARRYFEAIVRQDWPGAYATLHLDVRARWTLDQFTGLAKSYRRRMALEPEAVRLRACEERGSEAVAHVVITGRAAGKERQHRDGVALRQGPDGWGVALPASFGRGKR